MEIRTILNKLQNGELSLEEAAQSLQHPTFADLDFAKIDLLRQKMTGAAEVIYGAGKTTAQISAIIATMKAREQEHILITRLAAEAASELAGIPGLVYYQQPRLAIVGGNNPPLKRPPILVVTGGTSDLPVAEEAALTAEFLGHKVDRLYDVGVAGLHRLLAHLSELQAAKIIITVAGMEGALASVVGGLVSCPVIAVPTSVGYGASMGGLSALLAMLNSCASGISVVNIDNGFGAAMAASRIAALNNSKD